MMSDQPNVNNLPNPESYNIQANPTTTSWSTVESVLNSFLSIGYIIQLKRQLEITEDVTSIGAVTIVLQLPSSANMCKWKYNAVNDNNYQLK